MYFEPNRNTPLAGSQAGLDRAGELLRDNPGLTVTLRAYAAPFHSRAGQMMVAGDRAAFCRNYLTDNYGIETERMVVELPGAGRLPQRGSETVWETYRCVELIIQGSAEMTDAQFK